jgi:hypothetical protein
LTQERFIWLIDHPEMVSTISYEELKTLAFAYPYAHSLRYLLAIKAQQEGHPESARMLQQAAACSLDRTRLFALLMPGQLTPQKIAQIEKEEILELKPIETVQQELDALNTLLREEKSIPTLVSAEAPLPSDRLAPPPANTEPIPIATLPVENLIIPKASEYQSFTTWFSQFHPIGLPKEPTPSPVVQPPKETPPASVAQVLAEKSVAENRELISEPLARLLAKQGHREKAISMYERLCLAFPEKSANFAAEIEKLKN